MRPCLELGNAHRGGRDRLPADLGDDRGWNTANLGPGRERGELDLEPPRELSLLGEDLRQLGAGVALDHVGRF